MPVSTPDPRHRFTDVSSGLVQQICISSRAVLHVYDGTQCAYLLAPGLQILWQSMFTIVMPHLTFGPRSSLIEWKQIAFQSGSPTSRLPREILLLKDSIKTSFSNCKGHPVRGLKFKFEPGGFLLCARVLSA